MAARIEGGKAKLLARTGLNWSAKYPGALSALAAVRAVTAYLDGELRGVGEEGLRSLPRLPDV
jgi:ATP-dependent DNA ligase